MKAPKYFLILSLSVIILGSSLVRASLPVPEDLRNPFEPVDPTKDFRKTNKNQAANRALTEAERKRLERQNAFSKIISELMKLPVRGIIINENDLRNATVLLDKYILKAGTPIPASDFDTNGYITVKSVSESEIKVIIGIDLEKREVTIPLTH